MGSTEDSGQDNAQPPSEVQSSPQLNRYLNKAATQWSQYVNFNTSTADMAIAETVDDLLIRLDEFEHLVDMIESEAAVTRTAHLPVLMAKYSALQKTFDKIDRLEVLVVRVKHDVDQIEKQLVQAESTLPAASASFDPSASMALPLRALMKPSLLFGRSESGDTPDGAKGAQALEPYEPVRIFSTEEFFKKS